MVNELIKQLLEAGVHFGHQSKRWNPKMKQFIFGERMGVYIIDLEKTVDCLNKARDFLKEMAKKGEMIMFVGTKKQAQSIIKEEAERCGMYYVNERWLGGLLTNFQTIKKRTKRLKEIQEMQESGEIEKFTKKEEAGIEKELSRLKKSLWGIREMTNLPGCIFVVDPKKEQTAIKEAKRLDIPIVALIDTNCNPEDVNYPIPGNDDAIKSIKLITSLISDSILEGRKDFLSYLAESKKESEGVILKAKDEEKIVNEVVEEVLEKTSKEEPQKRTKVKLKAKTTAKESKK
ncbi:MAG: 30S ribosomal protein S2 [Candidatus Omnitrophota bacterium]